MADLFYFQMSNDTIIAFLHHAKYREYFHKLYDVFFSLD